VQRRDFLKSLGLLPVLTAAPISAWAAPTARYRNLLILIELKGGNDGLNTVIPYADPYYARLRPSTALPRDQVLQLSEQAALHPALKPLLPLWQAGQLALVQGVGYPHPNLSHFRSIEIWDTASGSEEYLDQGWLARQFAGTPPPASFAADGIAVGSAELGPLAGGRARTVALADTGQFQRQARLARDAGEAAGNPALAHILKLEDDIRQAAGGLRTGAAFRTVFPQTVFGNAVHTAAQVAASPAGVAVIKLSLGSFDTHTNQLPQQARLLGELAAGMAALQSALLEIARWDESLVMTYAEFGRRPAENASGGTDHGTANVHFACGGRVRGGLLGKAPDLARLEGGNLVHGVDFRSLYATVIQRHWGLDAVTALGGRYPTLDFLGA
jgi:uncharacterized protein (DUF1501 family)